NPRRCADQSGVLPGVRRRAASRDSAQRARPCRGKRAGAGHGGRPLMSRWRNGYPQGEGGWALVHYRQAFLADANGVLFPRDWLRRQDLPVLGEQPVGWFDDQPVHLFELQWPADMPGCGWQPLRQFMLSGDADDFRMLSYASQI